MTHTPSPKRPYLLRAYYDWLVDAVENISYDQHGNANDQEQSSIHKLLSFRNNFLFCL